MHLEKKKNVHLEQFLHSAVGENLIVIFGYVFVSSFCAS